MSKQEKNIADMIDIQEEKITRFVEKNGICAVVNAPSPSLMVSAK